MHAELLPQTQFSTKSIFPMSPLLKKSFKSSKCKTYAKLTLSRIKLLKNKRVTLVKQSRRDAAELLRTGQESSARIRVETVFREENNLAAYELIEQYCELVIDRVSTLGSQKECPPDLKEPIASLIYAAPRCADLPELLKLRDLFSLKYGKEFAVAALELRPDCGVSLQIIQNMSSHAPNGKTKLKLLKGIAAEYKVAWDSDEAVSESFKLSEDVLDGPSRFVSASEASQTNIPAPAVFERENSKSIFSRPVFPSDHKGPSAPVPSPESGKTTLSPYASSFQVSPSSTSKFSPSDGSNEVSNMKGKVPTSGKYDSLPQNTAELTRLEADTRTKLQPDNGAKSQETSEMGVYAKAKAEGIMDYKNIDNVWIQRNTAHDSLNSEADPYARAKADGRMDYENNSFKARTNEVHHDPKKEEQRIKVTQESSVAHLTHPKEDGNLNLNPENSYPDKTDNGTQYEKALQDGTNNGMPVFSHKMLDGNLARHTGLSSLKFTKSYSNCSKDVGSPYPDVATAAQVAFESAALAAEAAKAAIDLVNMDSRMWSSTQTEEADSLEREKEFKSKLNVKMVAQAMRNTHIGMGSKQNVQRAEHGERGHENEGETLEETLSPIEEVVSPLRDETYSARHRRSLELSKLHSNTDMTNNAVEHAKIISENEGETLEETLSPVEEVVSALRDEAFSARHQSSLELSKLHSNTYMTNSAVEGDFEYYDGLEKVSNLQNKQIGFSREQKDSTLSGNQEIGFSDIHDQLGVKDPNYFDGAMKSYISDQKFPQDSWEGIQQDEDNVFGSTWKHQSTSSRIGQSEKEDMQQIPRFDDYNSDEAMDTDTPFYTKGRAAIGKEAYGQFASSLSVIKPPGLFIDQGSDSGEESTTENLNFKAKSNNREFVQKEVEGFAGWDYFEKPEFDNYAEPTGRSISESITPSLFRGHNHSEQRLKGSDDDYASSRRKSSPASIIIENDKDRKPDKAAHRKLKWHSSTSEDSDFPSQSGELSSETDELSSVNLPSHNGIEARARKQGWDPGAREKKRVDKKTHYKLKWLSTTSDEFDCPSQSDEPSPEDDEFGVVKLENVQRSFQLDKNVGIEENRRVETVEPYQVHVGVGSKTSKGKSFPGESHRSSRLNRSQQR